MPAILQSHEDLTDMKLLARDAVNIVARASKTRNVLLFCLNGALSIALVLIGGLFAGLTLAFMGQDQMYLQVIAESGSVNDRRDALKVLQVLRRGKHWVLVSLLLGNVIMNETLPIVLDQDIKGGWFAVLLSTILIVIFGEIIPQSICAKYGLAVGAWSSRYVVWVMYALYPVAYPVAMLLDFLLGTSHGIFFNRAGLKTLAKFHERRGYASAERLNADEVAVISSVLDMHATSTAKIMTPVSRLFTLSLEAQLNDTTRKDIFTSGYSNIPVHLHDHPTAFVGFLSAKSLVALDSRAEVKVDQLPLGRLAVVRPDVSCQAALSIFRERKVEVALVTEGGTPHGQPLGIVTARDVLDELMGV